MLFLILNAKWIASRNAGFSFVESDLDARLSCEEEVSQNAGSSFVESDSDSAAISTMRSCVLLQNAGFSFAYKLSSEHSAATSLGVVAYAYLRT